MWELELSQRRYTSTPEHWTNNSQSAAAQSQPESAAGQSQPEPAADQSQPESAAVQSQRVCCCPLTARVCSCPITPAQSQRISSCPITAAQSQPESAPAQSQTESTAAALAPAPAFTPMVGERSRICAIRYAIASKEAELTANGDPLNAASNFNAAALFT